MPKKVHTKRHRYEPYGNERNRKPRLKTFTDENKAKNYAERLKLKNYKITRSKFGLSKKYKIVLE